MGKLTTHILDTAHGCPADGVLIELFRITGAVREKITATVTNEDGRCDSPILNGEAFQSGVYEFVFHAGAYFARKAIKASEPKFLDEVVIRFGIDSHQQHYHVPLLLSPYGYSTYRGS